MIDLRATPATDQHWMQRALELAQQAIGLVSPNPTVGCVLVQQEKIIGEGAHEYDRRDHAEVVALRNAGPAAKGATAYVTLEPCSHTGRTGPCADALIAAGIARVVVATTDPNPSVNGQGIARLRASGIAVETGVCETQARTLNDGFARYIQTKLPFVTLKAGVSLDGRIAPPREKRTAQAPYMLTGEASQAQVQRMRHESDALLTGIQTVLTDNPLLTDRSGHPRRRPLLRVVLDSALRTRLDAKLVRTAKEDVLLFCTTPNSERQRALEALGVRVERVETEGGSSRVSLKRVLQRLGEMEITSVLLESGSQLNASALNQQHVDKLSFFYAPVFVGVQGVPLVQSTDVLQTQLLHAYVQQFGPDFCIEGYLRDPWA